MSGQEAMYKAQPLGLNFEHLTPQEVGSFHGPMDVAGLVTFCPLSEASGVQESEKKPTLFTWPAVRSPGRQSLPTLEENHLTAGSKT